MFNPKLFLLGIGILMLTVAQPNRTFAQEPRLDQTEKTSIVWQHHIDSWNQRDVEAIARDYSDGSIMVVNGRLYKGRDQIKNVFKKLFVIFGQGTNHIDPVILNNELVYITWHFEKPGFDFFDGTDTFIIEDGIIKVQTIYSPLYEIQKEISPK